MSQQMLGSPYKIVKIGDPYKLYNSYRTTKIYCVPNNWITFDCNSYEYKCYFPDPSEICVQFHEYLYAVEHVLHPQPHWKMYPIIILGFALTFEAALKVVIYMRSDPEFNKTNSTFNESKQDESSIISSSDAPLTESDSSSSESSERLRLKRKHKSTSSEFDKGSRLSSWNDDTIQARNDDANIHSDTLSSVSCENILNNTFKSLHEGHKRITSELHKYVERESLSESESHKINLPMKNIHEFYVFEQMFKSDYTFVQEFLNMLNIIYNDSLYPIVNIHNILNHFVTVDLLSFILQRSLLPSRPYFKESFFSNTLFCFLISKNSNIKETNFCSKYYFQAIDMYLNIHKKPETFSKQT